MDHTTWLSSPCVAHVFADVNGRRLHLLDFGGSGRRVLLVHGVGGGAWTWHRVAPGLVPLGRVLAVDLPGFGDSQWAPDGRYATEQYVEVLRSLLAGGEAVDLVGFSWGGLVGLALAAGAPELVRRLVVVDIGASPPGSSTDVPPMPVVFDAPGDAVAAQRALAPRAARDVQELSGALQTHPAAGGGLARALDPAFAHRWPFRDDDLWDTLPSVAQPVLLVHAQDSIVLGASDAGAMVDALPDATLVTVPDCGHLVPLEQPVALTAAVQNFLTH